MHLVAIALSPAILLVWFLYVRNAYRPENKLLIASLFVAGAAAAGIALMLNHFVEKYTVLWSGAPLLSHRLLFWFLGIGLNEELAKMLVLLAVLYPRRDFTTPYQGLLGGATVALGFASVENLVYLERYGTATLLLRSILTVPAHACFTAPMGVLLSYAKTARTSQGRYWLLMAALGAATTLHGLYDIWLSFEQEWVNRLAYLQVFLMALLALRLMRIKPRAVAPAEGSP